MPTDPDKQALEELARRAEKEEPSRELDLLPPRIRSRLDIAANGCWNWTSPNSLIGRGRGHVSIDGKSMLHHRAVWTLLRGPIPDGASLCHHCDNPSCANPAHLYVGTQKTNVRDMWERGRDWRQVDPERAKAVARKTGQSNNWTRGARNPKAKLTQEQADEIRSSTEGSRSLAKRFCVHRTTIQRIRAGALWPALRAHAKQETTDAG